MHPLQSLLRRACAQLGPHAAAVDAAARAWCLSPPVAGRIGTTLQASRALSSAIEILGCSSPSSRPPAAGRGDILSWPSPLTSAARGFHGTTASLAAASDDNAAAVRRLAAARLRRERLAEAAAAAQGGSRHSDTGGAEVDPQQQQQQQQQLQQDGAVVAANTTAVTPVEGRASEAQLTAALDHPALIVTRPIEWGTVIFGYEQANKYTVYDESGQIVALVAEDFGGFGKEIGRQLLRTRRSFTATIFSADGSQVLFRLRRPAYLVSSTMHVEDGAGNPIGEIHQRWHLLKRNYDLYLQKSQFAAISGNFLAWEFELKDSSGGTLALVDRNFSGFAREIFTDAGKYVIHFGYQGQQLQQHLDLMQQQQHQQQQQQQALPPTQQQQQAPAAAPVGAAAPPAAAAAPPQAVVAVPAAVPAGGGPPPVTPMAVARTDVPVIPVATGNQLVVARPLELSERMVALACAITIDYDYFSQHSRSGGGLVPPLVMMPGGGGADAGTGTQAPGGAPEGPGAAGAAGAGAGVAGEVPLGGGSGGGAAAGGGFGGAGPAAGAAGGEAAGGFGDGYDPGKSWGEAGSGDGEMKWDLGGSGGGSSGGEEGGGGLTGLLGTLWGLFGGDE
ncbi:hypothetical protein PLESTB_000960200 [Pleodorina starrii]|uniref:Phospholipid scramblase n=1 Tax=Pleodorina starrii TaxID=330485 RepID=A0A9W6BMX9_9CHLO|nr:hypothetical protein PLESTM_001137900 [Pleodorina starrii]GLC55211.1 hypothetical protein PLESTB_000960200 [Pleodorina starrii]GLC71033.1 hypothetical protein PLESTF_001062900 [Pleodorina starrii]